MSEETRKAVDVFCERHPDWMEWLDLPPKERGEKFRKTIDAVVAERDRLREEVRELRGLLVGLGAGIPAAAILRAEDRAP